MSNEYEIEDNVPIPPKRQVKHKEFTEAFNKLQPGQSFWVECKSDEPPVAGLWSRARDKGWKVVARGEKNNGRWGTRIWRTE
jgi:hypothetical protein